MADPAASLASLAELLREGDTVISPHVREPEAEAALGPLAAAGPRAGDAPGDYAILMEAIREGYLLHYGEPRLIEAADRDLRLLAGDYLYALGLERLAARGDLEAVGELADLISLSAQLHAEGSAEQSAGAADALWLASAVAVTAGVTDGHERAKAALRAADPGATELLAESAAQTADQAGIRDALERAAESVGFAAQHLSDRG
jgi:hypothetical protein